MGDEAEVQVNGEIANNSHNPDVAKVVKAAHLIKQLSQSSFKNVPVEDDIGDTDNKKLEKQGSTDSGKELSKAVKVATFIRTLSKQSLENGSVLTAEAEKNPDNDNEEPVKNANDDSEASVSKTAKAAKLIRQLSKTAMLVSSKTSSIDEEPKERKESINEESEENGSSAAPAGDLSKVMKATQLVKRLSQQSMEKNKAAKASITDDNIENNESIEINNDKVKDSKNEEDDATGHDDAKNVSENGVETASQNAVLGDEIPNPDQLPDAENGNANPDGNSEVIDEGFNSDETEDQIKEKDPNVVKAAALVRQLSKQSIVRTGSADSKGEGDGEDGKNKKFKGRWRKSVKDKSRESSVDVQEKIIEKPEREGDIAEDEAEHQDGGEKDENEGAISDEQVIVKQPSAAPMDADGDAIKTLESTDINPKPRTGFCPCLG